MTELMISLIAFLSGMLIIVNGRAEYWRGKFEALEEEAGDHLDTYQSAIVYFEHAVNEKASNAARLFDDN